MYRGAMRCILSELHRQGLLCVVEKFELEQAKTKALVAKLDELGLKESLIVDVEISEALYLSARNLPRVAVAESATVDPVSLLSYPK
jgi:large subunit ribosomal protein L4